MFADISVLIELASLSAVTASSCILPVDTDKFCSIAVVTVLLLGVPMFTVPVSYTHLTLPTNREV